MDAVAECGGSGTKVVLARASATSASMSASTAAEIEATPRSRSGATLESTWLMEWTSSIGPGASLAWGVGTVGASVFTSAGTTSFASVVAAISSTAGTCCGSSTTAGTTLSAGTTSSATASAAISSNAGTSGFTSAGTTSSTTASAAIASTAGTSGFPSAGTASSMTAGAAISSTAGTSGFTSAGTTSSTTAGAVISTNAGTSGFTSAGTTSSTTASAAISSTAGTSGFTSVGAASGTGWAMASSTALAEIAATCLSMKGARLELLTTAVDMDPPSDAGAFMLLSMAMPEIEANSCSMKGARLDLLTSAADLGEGKSKFWIPVSTGLKDWALRMGSSVTSSVGAAIGSLGTTTGACSATLATDTLGTTIMIAVSFRVFKPPSPKSVQPGCAADMMPGTFSADSAIRIMSEDEFCSNLPITSLAAAPGSQMIATMTATLPAVNATSIWSAGTPIRSTNALLTSSSNALAMAELFMSSW